MTQLKIERLGGSPDVLLNELDYQNELFAARTFAQIGERQSEAQENQHTRHAERPLRGRRIDRYPILWRTFPKPRQRFSTAALSLVSDLLAPNRTCFQRPLSTLVQLAEKEQQ